MKRLLMLLVPLVALTGCATYGDGYYRDRTVYRDGGYYYPAYDGEGDYYYGADDGYDYDYPYGGSIGYGYGYGYSPFYGLDRYRCRSYYGCVPSWGGYYPYHYSPGWSFSVGNTWGWNNWGWYGGYHGYDRPRYRDRDRNRKPKRDEAAAPASMVPIEQPAAVVAEVAAETVPVAAPRRDDRRGERRDEPREDRRSERRDDAPREERRAERRDDAPRERRDDRREERRSDRRDHAVVGMGDHVPDFILRSFKLADIKAIRALADGTKVNDVFLAIIGGAMRRYLLAKDDLPKKTLTAMAPISVRAGGEKGDMGNQVAAMIAPLGTHIADPAERLAFVFSQTANSKAMSDAIALNSSSVNLVGNGLNKISTMELIKETVDIEEQNDLEELYFLWDEAIQLYELEEFPGDYDELNKSAENWYTYRGLVTQRLEVVARTLHERDYESLIDGQEVIEEGEESDEEENVKTKGGKGPGNISPRLQQLQQLSARALVPKKPSAASSLDDLFGANV